MLLEERLDYLKEYICREDFLKAKGIGNEVPFWIFDYPPDKELMLRDNILMINSFLEKKSIKVLMIDLYDICLELIESKIKLEQVYQFEEKKGSEELLKKLKILLKPEMVKKSLQMKMEENRDFQIIFLSGIGKAWPIVRSHSVLNNLQPMSGNIPLIAFYPGKYSKNELSLFCKFRDANYYRAFKLIEDKNI